MADPQKTALKVAPGRDEPARLRRAPSTHPDDGRAPSTQPDDAPAPPEGDAAPARPRRRWLRWGLFALLPVALAGGAYSYVTGGATVSTTDANVNCETVGVSTDVSGLVKDIAVVENQRVAAGQVLYRLDPLPFQIALNNAEANLAQTRLTLASMKEDYEVMLTNAKAQQDQVDLDQVTYDRDQALVNRGETPRQTFDQAKYTLQTDQNKLHSLQQQAQEQLARLGGYIKTPVEKLPQFRQAQAQVDEARRQLDHSVVKAAFAGTVTGVPATTPGRYLAASTVAFYLVDLAHVWVDAQPKETAMTYVRQGQPATVTVDAYPGQTWRGKVASLGPAAAQQFSLLPAENTSGNWVKVVQRVPLRVSIDGSDPKQPPLRAGMSAEIDIDTGHARGLPQFLKDWF